MLVPCLRVAVCLHVVKMGPEGPEGKIFLGANGRNMGSEGPEAKNRSKEARIQLKKDARSEPFSETSLLKDADARR